MAGRPQLRARRAREARRNAGRNVSFQVQVTSEGVWPDGTPYKIVVLPGGIRGTLYKSTKSGFVSWAPDDDDDMNYRDEWLSGVIGKALF